MDVENHRVDESERKESCVRNKFSLDAAGANDPGEEGRGFQFQSPAL